MINKILALLVVAAVGSVAAAQQTQALGTSVTTVNEFTAPVAISDLVINTKHTGTDILYTTNDGAPHDITVAAAIWAFTPAGGIGSATGYPALTVGTTHNSGELISTTNGLGAAVAVVDNATNVSNGSLEMSIEATADNVDALAAGAYATTLTYTMN